MNRYLACSTLRMHWLKDYGAFVAATLTGLVVIGNGLLQARRERSHKTTEWLRDTRLPRYVGFVRSAYAYQSAIFWNYADADRDIAGPEPAEKPDFDRASIDFRHQLSEVVLIGPPPVARAAKLVRYALWRYRSALEADPFAFDQTISSNQIDEFIDAAQSALDVPVGDHEVLSYREWLNEIRKRDA